jgi:probable addiction module antidote protein
LFEPLKGISGITGICQVVLWKFASTSGRVIAFIAAWMGFVLWWFFAGGVRHPSNKILSSQRHFGLHTWSNDNQGDDMSEKIKKPYITDKEFIVPILKKDPEFLAEYINSALRDDPWILKKVLRDVVDASGGVAAVARATGIGRPALHRMLSKDGNPEYASLEKILNHVHLTFGVVPIKKKNRHLVNAR